MLLGALSVGAQEKPVTAADYKQKVLEYSRQIKQSAEERIAMQHAIKAAKTAFFPAVDFSGSYQYRINKYDLDFGPGMAVEMDHNTYSLGATVSQPIYAGGQIYNHYKAGQISKTDLLQVQSRLKEAELNKSAAYKDYQIALQNLNVLMGVPPMTPVEIADAITTVQPLPMHIGEEAALQNRPDFTISRLNVEYQKRQINLSKAKYNPTLAIGFQGTWGTPMLNVKGSDQLWTPAVFASLKIPLFRWGARFKEVNSQKAILRSKEYVMDYTRDQISQEVANSWTSLTENTKQIDVAEEACKIAEENLDLNTFSYKEGKLPILDVLSAQLSWIQSYSSLIQTWYQQKASLAQYNKAVGIRRLQ